MDEGKEQSEGAEREEEREVNRGVLKSFFIKNTCQMLSYRKKIVNLHFIKLEQNKQVKQT